MKEEWRDIKDYEGRYQVSNLGNVKSMNYYGVSGWEHPLKPDVDREGRLLVTLSKNGKSKYYQVHRLVADAFIPDRTTFKFVDEDDRLKYVNNLDKLDVNHKDEEPKNNMVTNLEWCTRRYNLLYGTRGERAGKAIAKANINNPKRCKKVYQYDLKGNFIKEWPSAHEIKRQLGYSAGGIDLCCNGKQKTYKGFVWSYEELTPSQVKAILNSRYDSVSKRIYQYDLDGNFIREWESMRETERQLGYFAGGISMCCRGKCKQAYGFIWRYADDID